MKERLTGAIILVALLVLLVPELLTGPERFTTVSKAVGTEGAPLRSYTIDLQDDAANRQPPPSAPAVAVSDEPVAQAAPEPEVQSPAAAEVPPPVDDAARGTAKPMGSGADASAANPESPAAATKPATATPPSPADDKPRSAFGPNAAARAPSEKPSAAAKAEAQKAEAAKAEAARLAAAKAESSKPAPKPDATRVAAATPEPAKSAGTKGWAVQLGVFGSRENAERLAKQVKGSGFPVLVNETSGKDGKKLYWVRVGPEADPSAADALSTKLKAAGHRDARVVSYP